MVGIKCSKDDFSYIVDVYTLIEHIYQQITEVDSLSNLGKLYKSNSNTISEAVATISVKVSEPRSLTVAGAHHVVNAEVSYFLLISSYFQ